MERGRVPDHRSDLLKGSLPWGPSGHPGNTRSEYVRLSEQHEKESRDEATQRKKRSIQQRVEKDLFICTGTADTEVPCAACIQW